ncbi:MAG: hypothetical protein ACP5P3_00415 [Ignavibacteria bacterium]
MTHFSLPGLRIMNVRGHLIYLIPHSDWPWRIYRIFIKDGLRELDIYPYSLNIDSTVNKGVEISFVNAEPIYELTWIDPNFIPAICAPLGEEF